MKVAFLTEMGFRGKVPITHENMRTEFAWMHSMDADHYCIYKDLFDVRGYDEVFIIFPKGKLFLSAEGSKIQNGDNPVSELLKMDIVSILKSNKNRKVSYVQEGPHWWWNDYEIEQQINFYNFLSNCDKIYAHNQHDTKYYRGMFSHLEVDVIKTLMIDKLTDNITPIPEDKVIIGGNFARWYGGFESYIVASEFNCPVWVQTSHAMRENENLIENLNHLPRLIWIDWMKELSTFKYGVHLMPTVAAGTFSLNCAYFGIPVIGNIDVDTQKVCHPELSVQVNDVIRARTLARRLKEDVEFYNQCSMVAKNNCKQFIHF